MNDPLKKTLTRDKWEDIQYRDWQILLGRIADYTGRDKPITLSGKERQLLISFLKRSVDIAPLIEVFGKMLRETLLNWSTPAPARRSHEQPPK